MNNGLQPISRANSGPKRIMPAFKSFIEFC